MEILLFSFPQARVPRATARSRKTKAVFCEAAAAVEGAIPTGRFSFSLPGRGCWTRGDFHGFLNAVWVCAEQPEPVQKTVGGGS